MLAVLPFAALLLAAATPAPEQIPSPPAERSWHIDYNGTFLGIPLMRASINAALGAQSHSLRADFRSAGLAAMIKSLEVKAQTRGYAGPDGLRTLHYQHQENDGHKNRHLQMNYGDEAVKIEVDPPLHSMGMPPASQAQRLEAIDPLSAFLALTRLKKDAKGQRCHGRIKVFDGKQRYDLKLQSLGTDKVSTEAWKGEAERCTVYYVPVAGFDADDLKDPSVYDRPVYMWLAEAGIRHGAIPVRFSFDAPIGRFIIKAHSLALHETD